MGTKTPAEISSLLDTEVFSDWHRRYLAAHQILAGLRTHGADPIERELLRAGEYQELAAHAQAELEEIDDGFQQLADYELQRQRCTQIWVQSQHAEQRLFAVRAQCSETRRTLHAISVDGQSRRRVADENRLRTELKALEAQVDANVARCDSLRERLDHETARRDSLWNTVQGEWLRGVRLSLARAEYAYLARRADARASTLQETPDPGGGEILSENAVVSDLMALVEEAERQFEAIMIEEFLYWTTQGGRSVFCVPLHDHPEHLNVQLKALGIYSVEDRLGLDWIEPIAVEDEPDDDPRLDVYFLIGRHRTPAAGK